MKLLGNQFNVNAKSKLTFALCTALALSASALYAADTDAGAAGTDSITTPGKAGNLSRSDEKFIKDAAHGNWMEVQMGKLGVQKAQSSEAKQFAQRLIDDHTKANAELQQLAARKGVTLPDHEKVASSTSTTTDTDRTQVRESTEAEHHGDLKKLEGLSGTEFDRAFAKAAVKDHEKDVSEFEKASKKTQDTELKSWIDKTLPTLREHLTQAKSLESQSTSTGAASSQTGTDTGTKSSKGTSSDTK